MTTRLTASERKIIQALGWGDCPNLHFDEIRLAARLTICGGRRVVNSMEDRMLIGRSELPSGGFYTTFKGARAAGLTANS